MESALRAAGNVRMERRLEHDMSGFDDMGLPDAPDCLLEAFEGGLPVMPRPVDSMSR